MAGMKSWSVTASDNVLANTGFSMDENMLPSTLNNSIRSLMADVRKEWAQGADIASATPDLSAATGGYLHITGTTTITSFGTVSAGIRKILVFDGALQLTHSANLRCPGSANKTTAANDTAIFVSEGAGVWRCVSYVTA